MKKSVGELIDGLGIVNIKIFFLVDKVQRNKHTRADAKKLQDLNKLRSEYMNAINAFFEERQEVKV